MQRPLTGEPLAVDLVNTRWHAADGECDLLGTDAGLRQWMAELETSGLETSGLETSGESTTGPEASDRPAGLSSDRARSAVIHTREILLRTFEHRAEAVEELNAILARGFIVRSLADGQIRERQLLADETWRLSWLAADDYLRLRQAGPDAIRRCGNPDCVLYFYDPAGRRRWCSMAGCGNRAKARRHYANQHGHDANQHNRS